MKKIALFLLLQIIVFNGFASHLSGGQVWLEYNGTNYTVHFSIIRACEVNAAAAPQSVNLLFRSLNLSDSISHVLTNPTKDTVSIGCANISACHIRQNQQYPGFIVHEFIDTISLRPSDDWEVMFTSCCMSSSIVNLPTNGFMALGAMFDNTSANTGVHFATSDMYFAEVNDTARIPMQCLGAYHADSIVFSIAEPYNDYFNKMSTQYGPVNYSLQNPLGTGSVLKYDKAAQELVIFSPQAGKYHIAFELTAYKSGKAYSGTHMQTQIVVYPRSTTIGDSSKIIINKNSVHDIIACEGFSGTKVIDFIDTNSNSPVQVDVDYPNPNSVYSVSHSVSTSAGKARVTLNWSIGTAPVKPQAPFEIRMRYGTDTAGCGSYKGTYVTTIRLDDSCKKDVWPGDANNDKIANLWDILAIGVNYNDVGYARQSTSNNWQAYYCPAWNDTWSNNNINTKYADCNGDGIVNLNDITAVSLNFGKTHPKGTVPKPTAGPDLKFEPTGIEFPIGAKVRVPIVLGNANEVLNGELYGWSGDISLVGLDNTAIGVYPRDGFLAHSGTNVTYKHSYGGNNIGWAHTRTDRQGIAGANGVLCMVEFYVPANTPMGTRIDLQLSDVNLIDKDGNLITEYDVIDTFAYVSWPSDVATIGDGTFATVVPNPTHGKAYLHVDAQKAGNLNIQITNVMGAVVHRNSVQTVAGNNIFALPTDELAPAMYIIHLQDEVGNSHALKAMVR